ncbi:uncharacterized protein LOC107740849 [Sinocyclocheilus rhinocerous]|uniref:uncharacterized protein LOC107740849 n=1 Tax=Sinocyclocheilus rhinocerous TaxID=307959 RepID=UPI0007B94A5B|nr:PREDICTED: uncharacterized protein LOC107740849 [Sinocyclocheilus rhinocerous]
MNAVNVVQLFILVWTFTAVCQADDGFVSASCDDVTGSVGKEVTLTCSISQQYTDCCIVMYMFQYPGINDTLICAQELPCNLCDQSNSFSCRYTPTTARMEKIVFFVQTMCGMKRTEFSVNTKGLIKPEIVTEAPAPVKKDFIVSCENVTGSVGKEVTLTRSVSLQCTECCITKYKFQYPENINDSVICQVFPVNPCEQRNSFTCRYTPATAMTEQFRFFVQTNCGMKRRGFAVGITESMKREIDTEAPGKKEEPVRDISETSEQKKEEGRGYKIAVIAAVISCFIIVIMPVIYKLTQKHTKRNRTFLSVRHEDDNSNHLENVI